MKTLSMLILLAAAPTAGLAQLSADQKLSDFGQLVGLLDKRYAAYDWTKQVYQFDLLDVQSWVNQVAATQTDLDFYDLCSRYIASLHDGGSAFAIPSDFEAKLGFTVNLIEGHALITTIDRGLLPAADYPFGLFDEMLSLDGKDPAQWVTEIGMRIQAGSPRANQQVAASLMTDRLQIIIPHAADVGDSATVVIRRTDGSIATYAIPWVKLGTPIRIGPVLTPKAITRLAPQDTPAPPSGFLLPPYKLPESFVQRLGRSSRDAFLSGTYSAGGHTIGYLRPASFNPITGTEFGQLDPEVAYLQQNTDGLIIDAWGGQGFNIGAPIAFGGTFQGVQCYADQLATRFLSSPGPTIGYGLRATRDWIASFESTVNLLKAQGAPQTLIDQAQANLDAVTRAYTENRGMTPALPLCGLTLTHVPLTNRDGTIAAYTKPIVVLVNELTSGPAELFAAMLQDASRARLFGMPTAGIGTLTNQYTVGSYAEGLVGLSTAIAIRPTTVAAANFPPTSYIQNVGVQPDVSYDIFTLQELASIGTGYVDRFSQTLLNAINAP